MKKKSMDYILGMITGIALMLAVWGCAPDPNYVSPEQKWKNTVESWKGSHYSEFLRANGAYTREVEDGLGGKILIYSRHTEARTTTKSNILYGSVLDDGTQPQSYTKHTPAVTNDMQVYINKDGIIYDMTKKKY